MKEPLKFLPILEMLTPVRLPCSPAAHPPLILYVPLKVVSAKFPMKVMTCPSMTAEVRVVLFPVTVVVKPMVVDRSKQSEPSTWNAPLTAAPAWPRLPANVMGGFPGTVDAAVNCQLPSRGGVWGAEDACVEFLGVGLGAPPHPQKRTATERARMISKRAMGFLLSLDIVKKCRQACHETLPSPDFGPF